MSIPMFSLGGASQTALPPLSIRLSFGGATSSTAPPLPSAPPPPPPLQLGGGGGGAGGGGSWENSFCSNMKPIILRSDGEKAYLNAISTWREVQDSPMLLLPMSLYRSPTLLSSGSGSGSGSGDGGGGGGGPRISFNKEVTVFSKPSPLLGAIMEEKVDLKGSSGGGRPSVGPHISFVDDATDAATPRN